MSTISYVFGLTASIIRNIRSIIVFFEYYRIMKISINPNFEISDKLLLAKKLNYMQIFYFSMCFLYIYNMALDETILYYTLLVNFICYIIILNMILFSIKQQNQMLLQTLCVFFLYQISIKFININLVGILLLCSIIMKLINPIKAFRKGFADNDEKYFDVYLLIHDIILFLAWLIYSLSYNIIWFSISAFIQIFFKVCFYLGYLIVIGKINKNTKIYSFLINLFFIEVNTIEKNENNIL